MIYHKYISIILLLGFWNSVGFVVADISKLNDGSNGKRFKVMSYNVRNYLWMDRDRKDDGDDPKPEREKEALFKVLHEEGPDILGLMEVGSQDMLEEIVAKLKELGDEFPHREWIEAGDKIRHVCLLSRHPIVARDPHDQKEIEVGDRRYPLHRGFVEVDVEIEGRYRVKVYVAHLKSKRSDRGQFDSHEVRLQEVKWLRYLIHQDLESRPDMNLILMGDLNDTPDSPSVKWLMADLQFPLIDLMPVDDRGYSGTYYVRQKRRYERIDYLLVSKGLMREHIPQTAKVRDDRWAKRASDHFPISAQFWALDR